MFRSLRCGFHHYTSGRGSISKNDISLKFDSRVIFTSRIPTVAPPRSPPPLSTRRPTRSLLLTPAPPHTITSFPLIVSPDLVFPLSNFFQQPTLSTKESEGCAAYRSIIIQLYTYVLLFSKLFYSLNLNAGKV